VATVRNNHELILMSRRALSYACRWRACARPGETPWACGHEPASADKVSSMARIVTSNGNGDGEGLDADLPPTWRAGVRDDEASTIRRPTASTRPNLLTGANEL